MREEEEEEEKRVENALHLLRQTSPSFKPRLGETTLETTLETSHLLGGSARRLPYFQFRSAGQRLQEAPAATAACRTRSPLPLLSASAVCVRGKDGNKKMRH